MTSLLALLILTGCKHPRITAVNLNNPKEPKGIPYYLPKPYLIITKNIRYIPTPTVGLTATVPIPSTFDASAALSGGNASSGSKTNSTSKGASSNGANTGGKQAKTNAVETAGAPSSNGSNANSKGAASSGGADASPGASAGTAYGTQVFGPASIAVVPPASVSDGLVPQEFYTYQIVYMPDLTQKYGLRIKGGAGEFRATENLVNGWMHTGPGPVYMRDSFTSQNVTATGQAVADVSQALGQVALSALGIPSIPGGGANPNKAVQTAGEKGPSKIPDYAQIFVFEPVLSEDNGKKTVKWHQVDGLPIGFSRDWIELERAVAAGQDGAPAPGNKDVEGFIQQNLQQKGWANVTVHATLGEGSMTVSVTASKDKAKAPDLKTDTVAAAKDYIQKNSLPILENQIVVQPSVQ
jgi:hypothetical protein